MATLVASNCATDTAYYAKFQEAIPPIQTESLEKHGRSTATWHAWLRMWFTRLSEGCVHISFTSVKLEGDFTTAFKTTDSTSTKKDQTQPMGRHFSQPGHDWRHMVPFAIEEVIPKSNPMLKKQSKKIWICNTKLWIKEPIPDSNHAKSNIFF